MIDLEANLDGACSQELLKEKSDAFEARPPISIRRRNIIRSSRRQSLKSTVSEVVGQEPASGQGTGESERREDGSRKKGSAFGKDQDDLQHQADLRAQFYEHYRKEAEEYDREFMKKHDEDLNTTLIFAGLFSAVTSAFIIQVDSQLQPDTNQEMVALLRVLIHTIDSTALGGVVPTIPQWSGPPLSLVHVTILLYASLAASLFSGLLAMLGKQWLNRYDSVDMRGSAIERSQNRQRKLNGVIAWRFDQVMEWLPLMLQISLLLLGCALSIYLWSTSITIAAVVLGGTTFGVIIYTFFAVAGAVFISCPYQTPAAQMLRFLWKKLPDLSIFFPAKGPKTLRFFEAQQSGQTQTLDEEVSVLDFGCISWILQTSLDKSMNELTLEYLGSVLTHPGSNDGIVADCLKVLISCVSVTDDDRVVVTRGSERLTEISATCLLRALSHRLVDQPLSSIPRDVQQRHTRVFPSVHHLLGLPFYHTITVAHSLITSTSPDHLDWSDLDPSTPESLWLAHNFVKIAWHRKKVGLDNKKEVPRWILQFSLHSLLWDPEPPLSVIADCLSIVAIDLGCRIPQGDIMKLDKSGLLWRIVSDISLQLEWMGRYDPSDTIRLHNEPVASLALWAATQLGMVSRSQRFDEKTYDTLHQLLDATDRLHSFDPQFAVTYADMLLDDCIDVDANRVAERPGLEWTARAASFCMLRALSAGYQKSAVDIRLFDRYVTIIPPRADFEGSLCRTTMNVIDKLLLRDQGRFLDWSDYSPPQEYALFAKALAHIANPRGSRVIFKVPRWVLRFALHSLSKDPPPPTPVTTACLSIIATDLGCSIPSTDHPIPKSNQLETISIIITQKLKEMITDADSRPTMIHSKRKALTALFPYVVLQVKEGQHEMFDLFLRTVRTSEHSGLMWVYIEPFLSALLDEKASIFSKRAAMLISPHVPWWLLQDRERLIQSWAGAASTAPYTEDIGRSVVDTLLQVASWKSPTIPAGMWSWLNKRPQLPPICPGRYWGSRRTVFRPIRALNDIETFTSYLLLVWSEWDFLMPKGFNEMCASMQKDFVGEEMGHRRQDLLRRLGHIRRELELGLEHIQQQKPMLEEDNLRLRQDQYRTLEEILMKVDKEANDRLIRKRSNSTFTCAIPLP